MADDVHDVRWKEFENLGEEEVRKRTWEAYLVRPRLIIKIIVI
jgi:hypothetical protein